MASLIHPGIPVLSSHREFVVEPQPTGCRNPSAHRRRPGTKKGAIRLGKQVENRDLTRKIMEKWHGDTIGISVGCDCCGYNYHGTSNHADKCNNVPGLTLRWKHMGFSTKYIKHWEYAHALFLKSALIPLFNMFLSHHLAQAHRRGRREGRSAGRPRSRPAWLRTSATGHEGTAHRDLQTGWGWGLPTFMLVNNMIQY